MAERKAERRNEEESERERQKGRERQAKVLSAVRTIALYQFMIFIEPLLLASSCQRFSTSVCVRNQYVHCTCTYPCLSACVRDASTDAEYACTRVTINNWRRLLVDSGAARTTSVRLQVGRAPAPGFVSGGPAISKLAIPGTRTGLRR